jgi:2-oxoglutarate ferredoxin oxidoreductase subunit alpha
MVEKRMKKLEHLEKAAMPPVLTGGEDYETLVIGWGSNFGVIKEALGKIGNNSISFLHFNQVYPLHSSAAGYLKKAKNLIIVENNATSQFGKLLKLYTGAEIRNKILKYDGMPFSVEEVVNGIRGAING